MRGGGRRGPGQEDQYNDDAIRTAKPHPDLVFLSLVGIHARGALFQLQVKLGESASITVTETVTVAMLITITLVLLGYISSHYRLERALVRPGGTCSAG